MRTRQLLNLVRGAMVVSYFAAPLFLFVSPAHATTHRAHDLKTARTFHDATAPDPVSRLRVHWFNRHDGKGSALVSWSAPKSNGGSAIQSYVVTEDTRSCSPSSLDARTLSCTIGELEAGVQDTFTVTATNGIGSSTRSVVSTLGAEGQDITFLAPLDTTFDKGPLTLTATASSGLPVSFVASGACVLNGSVLSFTRVGSCSVTASQAGSTKFLPAQPVANFFQITQGTALLHFASQSFTADGNAHVPLVEVSPSVPGLVLTYCLNSGFGQKVCSRQAPRDPGVYQVSASLNNLDYLATPVRATETINAPAAVLPDNLLGTSHATPSGTTHFTKVGVQVVTTAKGFVPGHSVDVGAVSEESMGSFVVPSSTSTTAWLDLLRSSSSSTSVISTRLVNAFTPQGLSVMGSVAFPFGNFPGAGKYQLVEVQSSGFVPHTTVTAVMHSSPTVLSQSAANANGVVTLVIPIARSLAGQSHEVLLSGTYLVTTTTAGADGAANAAIDVSKALLSRLVPGAPVVLVFRDVLDPTLEVSNSVSLPSRAAYAAYVKLNTPLHLARYKPIQHPNSTMKGVTGAAAALSAVAAGVAVARAAGAAGAAGSVSSVASHGATVGSRGAAAAHRGSTETIEAVHHTHDANREHVGDHSFTWRFPGRQSVDDLSLIAPVTLARYSPLAAISIADAGYWRAMFGSLSLSLPLAGAVLGVVSVIQTRGWPLPPHLNIFLAIIILGFLDATAGIAAAGVSLVAATVTGHIFSLNMVISGLLLATLWFGLPVMVKKVRPFIRPHPRGFQDWWVRIADLFVGSAFAGFLAAKLVDSFSLVSNLKIGLVVHGNLVGYVIAGVCVLRYCIATFAVFFYPKRLGEVTPPQLPEQTSEAFAFSLVLRLALASLILAALLGKTWFVPPLVGLLGLGMYVRGRDLHVTIPNWCYRIVPRNVGKIFAFEVVGTVVTGVVSQYVASPYWQIAALLSAIFLLGLVVDLLSATHGRDWPNNWMTRLGGIALFLLTVAQMTDNLIT